MFYTQTRWIIISSHKQVKQCSTMTNSAATVSNAHKSAVTVSTAHNNAATVSTANNIAATVNTAHNNAATVSTVHKSDATVSTLQHTPTIKTATLILLLNLHRRLCCWRDSNNWANSNSALRSWHDISTITSCWSFTCALSSSCWHIWLCSSLRVSRYSYYRQVRCVDSQDASTNW